MRLRMAVLAAVWLLCLPLPAQDAGAAARAWSVSDFYAVDYLAPPEGEVLEIGGMDFLPDGRLVVSTRRGRVWVISDPGAADPREARFTRFAEGLHEGLGLKVVGDQVFVLQRGELSGLLDRDGDGRAEEVETICDDWGLAGNYHEFAYGLPRDADGNWYVGTNLGFENPKWYLGQSLAPWRGWILRITPEGRVQPVAPGFRSPNGIGLAPGGDLFVTDNQGDWMPACPLYHVRPDRFYGHPAGLRWTAPYRAAGRTPHETDPPGIDPEPAAVWFPYGLARSAAGMAWDQTEGRFGPYQGQMFVAEVTKGSVVRTSLEQVAGAWQGAAYAFRGDVGAANRLVFGPDGTLYVGMTNRGWGGAGRGDGIARIRWTRETPMDIRDVHLLDDGFEIDLTLPLAEDLRPGPEHVRLEQYDYNWWWKYGSPETNLVRVPVAAVEVAPDRRHLTVRAPALRQGMVARLRFSGLRSGGGKPLLCPELDYTINRFPTRPDDGKRVANRVPPPPTPEEENEGWVFLNTSEIGQAWKGQGWQLCNIELDPKDPAHFAISPGNGAYVNAGSGQAGDLALRFDHGDIEADLWFVLPVGARATVCFQGRYGISLADSRERAELAPTDCGGVLPGADPGAQPGVPPQAAAGGRPGDWQHLQVVFRAPRFHRGGRLISPARFERVLVNEVLVQEDLSLPVPGGEVRGGRGPLVFRGTDGPVGYRMMRIRPLDEAAPGGPWQPLFDGSDLLGWRPRGPASWHVQDGMIVGTGGPGLLGRDGPRLADFELRASLRISYAGAAALQFRESPSGAYQVVLDTSGDRPFRTGSVPGVATLPGGLIPHDTWFDLDLACYAVPEGVRIRVALNGLTVVDAIDADPDSASGTLGLVLEDGRTRLECRRLEFSPLP